MYLSRLQNVFVQIVKCIVSERSFSQPQHSILGPCSHAKRSQIKHMIPRCVTKYDTIHQNWNKKCVTVATAFSETGQTDWMSYWGERWGEGGFECESDTKIYQNITILYLTISPQYQDTTIPRYIRILPFHIWPLYNQNQTPILLLWRGSASDILRYQDFWVQKCYMLMFSENPWIF